jgi:hypothetical protein
MSNHETQENRNNWFDLMTPIKTQYKQELQQG